jgi:hypothetical protein
MYVELKLRNKLCLVFGENIALFWVGQVHRVTFPMKDHFQNSLHRSQTHDSDSTVFGFAMKYDTCTFTDV